MTQRETVLQMLRDAGEKGIRSDEFFKAFMPRAAARIQELRDSGVEISSEREGKYVRYRLLGVGRESDAARDVDAVVPLGSSPDSDEQECVGVGAGSSGSTRARRTASADSDATPASVQHSGQTAGRAFPGASPPRPQSVPEPLFPESALERMADKEAA